MKRPLAIICFIISVFLALNARFSNDYTEKYKDFDGTDTSIRGTVSDISFKLKDGKLNMIITLEEGIMCYMSSDAYTPHIGSTVVIKGHTFLFEDATNEGQFNMRTYYEILNIHIGMSKAQIISESREYSHFKDQMFRLRRSISSRIDAALPSSEASLLKTMLLGEKTELDSELKELYRRNGIAHILAISGLHISLLGLGLYKFLRLLTLRPRICALLSSALVISYGFLTGFSVSSMRAILMFSISMLAILLGRTYDIITALALASLLILSGQPLYVYHSGFIFSFGYILGITLIVSRMPIYRSSSPTMPPIIPYIINLLRSSVYIALIGLPLNAYCYYQIPIYSIFLNILVIPVMGILVPIGILMIITMYIDYSLSSPFICVIRGILDFFEKMAMFTDSLPGHYYTPGRPTIIQIIAFYILLLIYIKISKHSFRSGDLICKSSPLNTPNRLFRLLKASPLPAILLRPLLITCALIILFIRIHPSLELDFLDVGQGDCTFVHYSPTRLEFPGLTPSYNLLIDGGSSSVSDVGKYRILPFLKYKGAGHIDAIVATHPDQDHINGLIELMNSCMTEGIKIDTLFLPNAKRLISNEKYILLVTTAQNANIDIRYISLGDWIKYKELELSCLSPNETDYLSDENECSVVLSLTCEDFSALFTGDIEGTAETKLISYLKTTMNSAPVKEASTSQAPNERLAVDATNKSETNITKISANQATGNILNIDTSNQNAPIISDSTSGQILQVEHSTSNNNHCSNGYNVLKVAHHGSGKSTPTEFIEVVKPDYSIISCGRNNRYGHPHLSTLQNLTKAGSSILRTDLCGQIKITN